MPETPPLLGPGWDFDVFWLVGRAVLAGDNPYAVIGSFYPPGALLPFAALSLLPRVGAYYIWVVVQIAVLLRLFKLDGAFKWFLFMPVLFIIASGQLDLVLLSLALSIEAKPPASRKSPFLAAIVTIKPQLAFVLLPWIIVRWVGAAVRGVDRRTIIVFAASTLAIHLVPLVVVDPAIYSLWFGKMSGSIVPSADATPGLFSLVAFGIPWGVIAVVAFAAAILSWRSLGEPSARMVNLLALPVGHYYTSIVLLDLAPWWLLVPVSWLSLVTAHAVEGYYPFLLMPLAALAWNHRGEIRSRLVRDS